MSLTSRNPSTLEVLGTYPQLTPAMVQTKLELAGQALAAWRQSPLETRSRCMLQLGVTLREKRFQWARLITLEMGCPFDQAVLEIEKCALIAEQYARDAETMLKDEVSDFGQGEAYVTFQPLGTILHVAPWNYPFYLALRPVIPALMAGNTVVLKHASNVPQCSLALEEIFRESGFPEGVFQSLLVSAGQVEGIIQDDHIAMVSVIGSETAGSQVAQKAGQLIKKTLLELGGSDPFIVLSDADLTKAIPAAVQSRLRNTGQSCNAAKRFIVMRSIADDFVRRLTEAFVAQKLGDPLTPGVEIGPLATEKSLIEIQRQVYQSISLGAKLVTGGQRPKHLTGYFYEPTVLTHVTRDMPVFKEEVFGPVAPIMIVDTVEEAIAAANDTPYGLGASLWTENRARARALINRLAVGNVAINTIVRGHPQLPYGGIKKSGYGREMGSYGIKEFVNIKSVVIQ